MSRIHLISGLPRSGSTLLAAILGQNPSFHAAMSGPVAGMVTALQVNASAGEYAGFIDNKTRVRLLRGVFEAYYSDVSKYDVIFDTNRSWTGRLPLLAELFPECRVICCVRTVGWIINSMEVLLRGNPLQLTRIFDFKPMLSSHARAEFLMNPEKGLIGLAWRTLQEAWFGAEARRLVIVQYDSLVARPLETMQKLYAELGERYHNHDFNDIRYEESEFDSLIGLPGMHRVREQVTAVPPKLLIPPDLFAKYSEMSFWNRPELNGNGVVVI